MVGCTAHKGALMSKETHELNSLIQGAMQGRVAFEEAVRVSIEQAAERGWDRLCWMDRDFADWPLGEQRVYAALQAWSREGRRIMIIASNFDLLISTHHRFVNWRRQWAHIIECWQCSQADKTEFPSLVLSPEWSLLRVDRQRCLCHASADIERVKALEEFRQHWLEKSSLGFPANVLGL
jgi:hypothetical protein